MNKQQALFLSAVLLIPTTESIASDKDDAWKDSIVAARSATDGVWRGNMELGIVNTTGNTETQTINTKVKTFLEDEKWLHTVTLEALSNSDNGNSTAERYATNGQSDYKLGEKDYIFVMIDYVNDHFSGYEYRVSETLGYGRRVITNPNLTLSLEAGAGGRQSNLVDAGIDKEIIGRVAAKLVWDVSKTSSFTEDFSVDTGETSTITKSVTELTANVTGSLATKITYTVTNTSGVPVDVKNTDTKTAVTLVYAF